jgi:PII-like signaling protein
VVQEGRFRELERTAEALRRWGLALPVVVVVVDTEEQVEAPDLRNQIPAG